MLGNRMFIEWPEINDKSALKNLITSNELGLMKI